MISPDDKEKFLEALEATANVSAACKRSGIGRASVYRWLDEDTEFKKRYRIAMRHGREITTDFTENMLMKLVREGHFGAIKFALEANSKRFYRPRKPIDAPKEPRIIRTVELRLVDPDKITAEQVEEERRERAANIKERRPEEHERWEDMAE